jgi:hypothetical protein
MISQQPCIATLKQLEIQIKDELSRGNLVLKVRSEDAKTVSIEHLHLLELSEDFDIDV